MTNTVLTPVGTSSADPIVATPAQRRWQIGLIALGLLLLAIGGLVLLLDVDPQKYFGLVTWFAGALILHDGIIAMVVFGASVVMRKFGRRIHVPFAVIAILQGAIVVGAIIGGIVLPEILKKNIGTANPTLLPLAYGPHLVAFYVGLAVVTSLSIAVYYAVVARRRKA